MCSWAPAGWGFIEPRVHADRGLVRRRAAGQILLATTKKIFDEKTPRRSSLPSFSRKPRDPASAPPAAKSSHEKEEQVAQAHRCGRRTSTRRLERGRTEGRVAGGGSRRNVGWAQVGGEHGEQVGREQLGGDEQVGWGGDRLAYWERGPVWGLRQVGFKSVALYVGSAESMSQCHVKYKKSCRMHRVSCRICTVSFPDMPTVLTE